MLLRETADKSARLSLRFLCTYTAAAGQTTATAAVEPVMQPVGPGEDVPRRVWRAVRVRWLAALLFPAAGILASASLVAIIGRLQPGMKKANGVRVWETGRC